MKLRAHMTRVWTRLMQPAFPRAASSDARQAPATRRQRNAQRGVALLIVTAGLTVLGALQMSYRKRSETDMQSALNSRDDLRAHYLARSGINLSRLVIKVQQSVMDKFRKQIGDIQLAEFVPTMIRAFSGQKDEVEGLASLMGPIDTSKIKGLGLAGKQDFSLEMDTDDGRINLNCAGGSTASQQALEGKLAALVLSPEYDRFFLTEGPDGQLTDRATMVHAILDYVDRDESMFGAPGQGEQYGYDQTNEPYLAKNNYIDTVEELQLVRGIGDDFMDKFRSSFTVYGGCKVNLAALDPRSAPVFAMLIYQAAKNPSDPVLTDPVKFLKLVQAVTQVRQLWGTPFSVQTFVSTVKEPGEALVKPGGGILGNLLGGGGGGSGDPATGGQTQAAPEIDGLELDTGKLNQLVIDGPRRTYRVESTATVGRVTKRIFGIFDTQHVNQNNIDPQYRTGTWVYWRED